LPKAVAILQIHCHQQFVLAGKQTDPAAQEIYPVTVGVFRC